MSESTGAIIAAIISGLFGIGGIVISLRVRWNTQKRLSEYKSYARKDFDNYKSANEELLKTRLIEIKTDAKLFIEKESLKIKNTDEDIKRKNEADRLSFAEIRKHMDNVIAFPIEKQQNTVRHDFDDFALYMDTLSSLMKKEPDFNFFNEEIEKRWVEFYNVSIEFSNYVGNNNFFEAETNGHHLHHVPPEWPHREKVRSKISALAFNTENKYNEFTAYAKQLLLVK